jgi:hypothetical protein
MWLLTPFPGVRGLSGHIATPTGRTQRERETIDW